MFLIGDFSKINRITTKTLRYYDEIGLLKPKYIDDFTGYRYYTSAQLPRLHTIINLKQMGLSLKEIKSILDKDTDCNDYFKRKSAELQNTIDKLQQQILHINNYIKREEIEMKPVIKSLPEVIVASTRRIAQSYDTYFDFIPKMGEEMNKVGAVCATPSYCFIIYHDGEYKEKDIDVEVCEAVVTACKDTETLKFKKISKIEKAVCLLHKGPYSTFGQSYAYLYKWIEENGYQPTGLARESYIDGIWNKENKEDWLTEIQIPIGK